MEEMLSPEVELGMAGDGDGGWRSLREEGDLREEEEPEKMAAQRSGGGGGGGGLRRRRLEDGGVAMTMVKNPWPGQGVAAVVPVAAAAARRRAAAAVGLLPRPSLSSHLRGRSLLSFFK